jgi:type I restriction enzyme M protein
MIDVVQKLWGFCHTLRHDGIDYGDYIEQLTYLLFLKMADERGIDLSKTKFTAEDGRDVVINCSWPALEAKSGTALTDHYVSVLQALGKQKGLLGDIFAGALSRFTNPVNLKTLTSLIDETEWTTLGVDVKAAAFEGLLEKAASEGKKGAGQYFTPRILIQSIVRCMKPDPRAHKEFTICDPACGTGGFLVAAYEWLMEATKGGALDRELAKRVKKNTYYFRVPRIRTCVSISSGTCGRKGRRLSPPCASAWRRFLLPKACVWRSLEQRLLISALCRTRERSCS